MDLLISSPLNIKYGRDIGGIDMIQNWVKICKECLTQTNISMTICKNCGNDRFWKKNRTEEIKSEQK